jgi:hypothetical protein
VVERFESCPVRSITDSQGATCSGTTAVEVPHDLGHHPKHDKHDDDYDSFGWH